MWTFHKKIKSLMAGALVLSLVLPGVSYAAEAGASAGGGTSAEAGTTTSSGASAEAGTTTGSGTSTVASDSASLTISFMPEDNPTAGVEFRLYQVAELTEDEEYTVTPTFAEYPVVIPGADAETNRQLATTLPAYIIADDIQADYAETTGEDGTASFEGMSTGMYMVMGDVVQEEEEYVFPTPFMLELTSSVMTSCKFLSRLKVETVSIEVMKVWKDEDYAQRPTEVTIELYGGDRLYDTVTLSKENNWRHEWTGLDSGYFWTTREVEVPEGYTVSVEQQGNRYVFNNTRSTLPDATDPPKETTPPDATQPPEGTTPPDATQPPEGTTPPDATQSPEGTAPPEGTASPESTASPKPTVRPGVTPTNPPSATPTASPAPTQTPVPAVPTLPQTGVLWWPVPVLAAAGVVLILLGLLRRKGGDDEE